MRLSEEEDSVVTRAGFGGYGIDFSFVPDELVKRIIATMREYLEETEEEGK